MSSLGWITSYENALPFVVLSAWLGAEVVANLPGRIPIAVCENCKRVQVLPRGPLRRFWRWKYCTVCGGQLNYCCPNKHLLSLFLNGEVESSTKDIWCSICGKPSRALSSKEFIDGVKLLISQQPKEMDHMKLAPLIWKMIRGTNLGNELREHMSEIDRKYRPPSRPTRTIDLESNEPSPDDLFRGWAS